MEKIRLGIIGIGNMGSAHAQSFVPKCEDFVLAAVCDTNPARLDWAKEKLPEGVALFSDGIEMLDSGLIDACLVAVPHYDHPTYAMEAMKRGIHVMVEKPAGVYTKKVREMNELAKECNVVYGMMFNQRTNHVFRKVKELVDSGKYGEIRRTNWMITDWYRNQFYYDSGDWRATWAGEGGGVLMNQCPHQLDLWQWICGMPVKIQAHAKYGKWHDIEVEDDVTVYAEYANGATGVFVTTTGDGCGTNRFEVQMDKAKIVVENNKDLKLIEFEVSEQEFSKNERRDIFAIVPTHEVEVETDGLNEQHVGVLKAWGGAILRGESLVAGGEEGIKGLTISNAIHLSDWTGKMVEIPFDEDLYYEELMKRVATSKVKTSGVTVFGDTTSSYGGASNSNK